jgi:hypothetical protein
LCLEGLAMKCCGAMTRNKWEKTCASAGYPRDLLYFGREHRAVISRLGRKLTADVIGMAGVCSFWASKDFRKAERARAWAERLVRRMDANRASA